MNREGIIRMAQEAGLLPEKSNIAYQHPLFEQQLERFAALVASAEREACAKLCEDAPEPDGADLVERIRARGNVATNDTSQERVDKTSEKVHEAPRTWVGLTDEEIDQGLLRSNYAFKTAEAWRAGVVFAMTKLKDKNTWQDGNCKYCTDGCPACDARRQSNVLL